MLGRSGQFKGDEGSGGAYHHQSTKRGQGKAGQTTGVGPDDGTGVKEADADTTGIHKNHRLWAVSLGLQIAGWYHLRRIEIAGNPSGK